MDLGLFVEAFHFLRPWALVLLPVVAGLWWRVRDHGRPRPAGADGLAPHLRAALTLEGSGARRWQPIDGVALALGLAVLGAAGPTWSRVPDPFAAQTAPLVVVLEVTPSMLADDIAPSRLDRGKQKIRDLLDLRAGARTALVAYAGSAHRVVPLTEDGAIMRPYLEGLTPEIMPSDGADATAALAVARAVLAQEETPGAVLFVADGLDAADLPAFEAGGPGSVAVLSMLPDGARDRGFDALNGASIVAVQPDGSDIRQLDRLLNAAYRRALLDDDSQAWEDRGRWLAVPAALLVLLWFRRGWTMKWAVFALVLPLGFAPGASRAEGVADWFFTPDQQGRLAYQRNDFSGAAQRFTDPLWQGYAHFRAAQYPEAIAALDRLDTAEAGFIKGIALLRNRQYRDGVRAFEHVLELDPDYPGAAENLEVARRILAFVEEIQSQSDTGEETGIGADDVVFDNESGMGAETQIQPEETAGLPEMLSTETWMNSVNTRTGDFLRQRFLLEAQSDP